MIKFAFTENKTATNHFTSYTIILKFNEVFHWISIYFFLLAFIYKLLTNDNYFNVLLTRKCKTIYSKFIITQYN